MRFDVLSIMPPSITDREARPGDERFVTLTARRSAMPAWLADAAAVSLYEESEDSGFLYYTRFFRSRGGGLPPFRSPPLTPLGTFTVLVLPSDNDTWSVTLFTSAGDRPLKRMRHRDRWEAVLAACPAHAQWLDGDPLTDVLPMGGIADRYRRVVVDGRPVVAGVALLADAWACTNPSVGRGMSLGILHARHLRDLVREEIDDPAQLAAAWDDVTETHLTPWYRDTVFEDRARLREIDALRNGAPLPAPPAVAAALPTALAHDPEIFRAFIETRACLATVREVLARPAMAERILDVAGRHEPRRLPGPDREQLLALLA